jgi:tRNA pseudouridine-54 N-methylase
VVHVVLCFADLLAHCAGEALRALQYIKPDVVVVVLLLCIVLQCGARRACVSSVSGSSVQRVAQVVQCAYEASQKLRVGIQTVVCN